MTTPNSNQTPNPDETKVVPLQDHEKIVADLTLKAKKADEYSAALAQKEKEISDLKRQQMEGKEDFKGLFEAEKTRAADLETRLERMKQNVYHNEKFRTANAALAKAGLKPEALKILDRDSLDDLKVEATSEGRFLVHGEAAFVDRFKREYPFAFGTPAAPNVNTGGTGNPPPTTDEALTPAYMVELETKDPKKYKELLPKFLEQRKAAKKT